MTRAGVSVVSAVVCSALLACGGGGGGSGGGGISFDPGSLEATYNQGDRVDLRVHATFSAPDEWLGVLAFDDEGMLGVHDRIHATQIGSNTFSADFQPRCGLEPGDYSGTIRVEPCADDACSTTYSLSGDLPYHLTVNPAVFILTVKTGGEQAGEVFPCDGFYSTLTMVRGTKLELESSIPVIWTVGMATGPGQLDFQDIQQDSTTWSAVVLGYPEGPWSPDFSPGMVTVTASAISDPSVSVDTQVKVVGE
jgi:hypothetical protein